MFCITNDARFWDRIARKYAADPIADMAGYERTLERSRHYLKGDEMAFEFGCGTGTTALKLTPFVARIVATDISGEMIAIAREKAGPKAVPTPRSRLQRPMPRPGRTGRSTSHSASMFCIWWPRGKRP